MSRFTRPMLAFACCVLLLAGAGCLSLSSESLGDEVESDLAAASPPDGLSATYNYTYDDGTETVTVTGEVWLRGDGLERSKFTGQDTDTTIITYDGEQVWYYFPEQDLAEVYQANGDPNALNATYETYPRLVSNMSIVEAEEATVAGRETYHLVLEPAEDEDVPFDSITDAVFPVDTEDDQLTEGDWETPPDRIELWLDQESLFPVRSTFESPDGTRTVEYGNLTFESDLADERFAFDPPENASVNVLDVSNVTRYDDVAAADDATPFGVVEPGTVPEGYDLQTVAVVSYENREQTVASVRYANSAGSALLVQITDGSIYLEIDDDTVSVDGREARYERRDGNGSHYLTWDCGDLTYVVVTDTTVAREELVAVGGSIPAC